MDFLMANLNVDFFYNNIFLFIFIIALKYIHLFAECTKSYNKTHEMQTTPQIKRGGPKTLPLQRK